MDRVVSGQPVMTCWSSGVGFSLQEKEYGSNTFLKDAFLKFLKQKRCCIDVASRKSSSGMKEELVEEGWITPLHWRRKAKLEQGYKNRSRNSTLCHHVSVTKCKLLFGYEHAYCIVWKDAFWSSNNWISPTFILPSYAASQIPGNCKFWWPWELWCETWMFAGKSKPGADRLSPSLWSDTSVLWGVECCSFHLSPCALPQIKGHNHGIWYKATPIRGIIDYQLSWLSMYVSLQHVLACLLHLKPCSLCFCPAMDWHIPQNNPKPSWGHSLEGTSVSCWPSLELLYTFLPVSLMLAALMWAPPLPPEKLTQLPWVMFILLMCIAAIRGMTVTWDSWKWGIYSAECKLYCFPFQGPSRYQWLMWGGEFLGVGYVCDCGPHLGPRLGSPGLWNGNTLLFFWLRSRTKAGP